MARSVFLHGFRSLEPRFLRSQQSALEWIAEAHVRADSLAQPMATEEAREERARKLRKLVMRLGCATDRIEFRRTVLEDCTHTDWSTMRIFRLVPGQPAGAPASERSRFYSEVVYDVFRRFYAEEPTPPSALLHVTCTGYVAPSGAQRWVAERGWGRETEVVHAYHMGCYASLPAIRMAQGFLAIGKARIDLVHTELCALHLDPLQHSAEQLTVQTLFSDGLIRYSVSGEPPRGPESALEVLALREEIIPDTETEMTWIASELGMKMTLSREVPERIAGCLEEFVDALARAGGTRGSVLRESAIFAIHPGGPRIIDEIRDRLRLTNPQVAASGEVLRAHGNMSSATLPHIWERLLRDEAVAADRPIVSMAFGPGLTVSGALFRKASPP